MEKPCLNAESSEAGPSDLSMAASILPTANTSPSLSCQLSHLNSSIKLVSPHGDVRRDAGRITLSCGTITAATLGRDDAVYCHDAYIPRPSWRSPLNAETAILWAESSPSMDSAVALIRLYEPETIVSLQSQLAAVSLSHISEQSLWKHPFIVELLRRISDFCEFDGPLSYHGISSDPIGLDTVSFDPGQQAYVGSHIDSWEAKPTTERDLCKTRLCINLGIEDRYFLFINKSVQNMIEHLAFPMDFSPPNQVSFIAKRFMATFPEYPVIRLKVSPGEAYIAPTENIIHDASSIGLRSAVNHTAFRGNFSIRM